MAEETELKNGCLLVRTLMTALNPEITSKLSSSYALIINLTPGILHNLDIVLSHVIERVQNA